MVTLLATVCTSELHVSQMKPFVDPFKKLFSSAKDSWKKHKQHNFEIWKVDFFNLYKIQYIFSKETAAFSQKTWYKSWECCLEESIETIKCFKGCSENMIFFFSFRTSTPLRWYISLIVAFEQRAHSTSFWLTGNSPKGHIRMASQTEWKRIILLSQFKPPLLTLKPTSNCTPTYLCRTPKPESLPPHTQNTY